MTSASLFLLTAYMLLTAPWKALGILGKKPGCLGAISGFFSMFMNPAILLLILATKLAQPWWPAAVALLIACFGIYWKWSIIFGLLKLGWTEIAEAGEGRVTVQFEEKLFTGTVISQSEVAGVKFATIETEGLKQLTGVVHSQTGEYAKKFAELPPIDRFFFEIPTFYLVWLTAVAWFQLLS